MKSSSVKLKKGDVVDITVIDMSSMGYGIARLDGRVIFVDGGVSGDRLEIKIIKNASDYSVGRIEKVLEPSPHRQNDECALKRCGGCVLGHITREYELELKRDFVIAAFRKQRIDANVLEVKTDGNRSEYRNKVQVPVCDGKYGYYAKHSHEIIQCKDCLLSPPVFNRITEYVFGIGIRGLRHIYLRGGETVMLCLVCEYGSFENESKIVAEIVSEFPMISSVVLNINPDDTNVILGRESRVLYGDDIIYDTLCGCRFGISSKSFYQVNRNTAELLYAEAISRIPETSKNVADLYCGIGTIGICLSKARNDINVCGIEIIPDAVENAKKNAEDNGVGNATFICGDAMNVCLDGFDVVIVDPPRKGLSTELVGKLIDSKIGHIIYVSCNPETLARDSKILLGGGFAISSVAPFDMFPRTGSVECVTDFSR